MPEFPPLLSAGLQDRLVLLLNHVLSREPAACERLRPLAGQQLSVLLEGQPGWAPQLKLQCPEVDFVCRGDGEQLLLDLLENLENPQSVASLTWMKDGQVVQNPNRPTERQLDQWPFPDRESLELDYVESMPLDVPAVLSMERFTTMQTSRGCPWPCVFCDIPIFNEGKWRARSAQHVVDELKYLEQNGHGSVYFVDDHFLLQPKRIDAICKGIIDARLSIQWGIEGRVDSVAQHLFPAMAKAHCRTVMFGIESGSQKILDRLQKEQTLAEVETAVRNAEKAGMEIVHGFFTVGHLVIYDNIRRFVKFSIAGNVGKVLVMLLAPFMGINVALLPLQLLWLNLMTDGLLGLGLGVEPAEPGTMKKPHRDPKASLFSEGLGLHVLWVGVVIGVLALASVTPSKIRPTPPTPPGRR